MQYSRDKAEEILEELFHVGKIAPNDLTIFDDEVLPKQWCVRLLLRLISMVERQKLGRHATVDPSCP